MKRSFSVLLGLLMFSGLAVGNDFGMQLGKADLKSAGPLAFNGDGILFVGDVRAATLYAIDLNEQVSNSKPELQVESVDKQIAKVLGVDEVQINDLAVSPLSGAAYISVTAGSKPAVVRVDADGKLVPIDLNQVEHSKVVLPNAPEDKLVGQGRRRRNYRDESITDIAFSDGKVLISGIAGPNNEANVREVTFPFHEADQGVNIEIYHGAHGRVERNATVRTFVPFQINGEPYLLAGFQCTPLVKFPVKEFASGKSNVRGTTLAELGNRNRPLDMIVYERDGEPFLLLTNTARGVMKISTKNIERNEGIEERISGTAGQEYETIESLQGVEQLDKLNDDFAVVITRDGDQWNLSTVPLP